MKLKNKLKILNALVNEDSCYPADRVYRDGNTLIGTNGMQLLAFHLSEGESPDLTEWRGLAETAEEIRERAGKDKRSQTPEIVRGWLAHEALPYTVNFHGLLQFLHIEEFLKCPYCDGSGRRFVDENTDEDFWLEDPFEKARLVDIGGALMNGNMLISVLAHLPKSETVALSTWPSKGYVRGGNMEGRILRLVGDGWTFIQMSMDRADGEVELFTLPEVSR